MGAVLAGARSYAATADWAAHADHAVTVCGPTPHPTTFGRVLGAVDADALEQVLTGWVLTRRARLAGQRAGDRGPAAAARQVLAVDGKTLPGAHDQTGAGADLVAVYDHRDRLVLAQTEVAGGDELAALTATLATLPDLRDVLITAGALHADASTRPGSTPGAGTSCSPSNATSRRCAGPWPGCRGPARPDRSSGTTPTAEPSPTRSRSSTSTTDQPTGCLPTPLGRS